MAFFSSPYFGGNGSSLVVDGLIAEQIRIGDDYSSTNQRVFAFTILLPVGVSDSSIAYFNGRNRYRCDQTWSVAGTVTVVSDTEAVLTFELLGTDTAALVAGEYVYSLDVITDNGELVTVLSEEAVDLVYGRGATNSCQC